MQIIVRNMSEFCIMFFRRGSNVKQMHLLLLLLFYVSKLNLIHAVTDAVSALRTSCFLNMPLHPLPPYTFLIHTPSDRVRLRKHSLAFNRLVYFHQDTSGDREDLYVSASS